MTSGAAPRESIILYHRCFNTFNKIFYPENQIGNRGMGNYAEGRVQTVAKCSVDHSHSKYAGFVL